MIIGENRRAVIDNIKANAEAGNFYAKVEMGDPCLSPDEERKIANGYLARRGGFEYRFKRFFARLMTSVATGLVNKNTEIVGEIDGDVLRSGVIVTSNHFSPMENTAVRYFLRKNGVKHLNIVSQVTNFAMPGVIGFLMNYADTIPLVCTPRYMAGDLVGVLREKTDAHEAVLIYPEQEMWFNYRKPRPPKDGAYHFAAKLGCPIVSLFVEQVDLDEKDTDEFRKVKYRVHALGVIYPDKSLSLRENREEMCRKDYELKCAAYERAYGKKLSYEFENDDIAGWIYEET